MIVFLDDGDEEVPADAPRALKSWGKPFLLQQFWQTAFPWGAEEGEEGIGHEPN
jgi:hypothetical protein